MKKTNARIIWIGIALAVVVLGACVVAPTTPNPDSNALYTQAAHTIVIKITLDAGDTAVAQLTGIAQITPTLPPSVTPLPPTDTPLPPTLSPTVTPIPPTDTPLPPTATSTATATPTATALPPTNTPVPPTATPVPPTNTPVPPTATRVSPTKTPPPTATPRPPTPTVPPIPCDWVDFLADVTIIDGTVFSPGSEFTKTWRLQNIGSCTWTKDYHLVFYSGDRMDGQYAIPLTGNVPPGWVVDISVDLVAPLREGEYTGYWQLRNPSGVLFGIGSLAQDSFYVRIKVDAGDTIVYDLADNYCRADWQNSRVELPCPMPLQDEIIGFVYRDDSPLIETGAKENEPALITHPDHGLQGQFEMLGNQGVIAGTFPKLTIQEGDHFKAVIGCIFDYDNCNVLFYLLALKPNGKYETLGSWQEYYDGKFTRVDVDLSDLADKSIALVLVVLENGDSEGDWAFWLHPRIIR